MTEETAKPTSTDASVRGSMATGGDLHVFISHKSEDEQAARTVKDQLEPYGGDRLQFYLSEDITPGTDWREWIYQHLGNANLLFFLCTKPTSTWDWCLYEMGIFQGLHKGKIIVFHSPEGQPPKPLENLQWLPVTKDKVKEFLKSFFGTSGITGIEPPLARRVAQNDQLLDQIAQAISEPFQKVSQPQRPQYMHRHLELRVHDASGLKGGIPPGTSLIADRATLELMGLGEKPGRGDWTWGEIQEQQAVDKDLLLHLDETVCRANRGELMEFPVHIFPLGYGGRRFLPVIYRLDVTADKSRIFYTLFVEQGIGHKSSFVPYAHMTLQTSMTLAARLHWEVYDRFMRDIRNWNDEMMLRDGCRQLLDTLDNIEREADARRENETEGPTQGDRLLWAFDSKESRAMLDHNLFQQDKIKTDLRKELAECKIEKIQSALTDLRDLNGEIAIAVCNRYRELLERDMLLQSERDVGSGGIPNPGGSPDTLPNSPR